jgi:hypothetical protein
MFGSILARDPEPAAVFTGAWHGDHSPDLSDEAEVTGAKASRGAVTLA